MSDTSNPDPLAYSVKSFCKAISLSPSSFWKMKRNGEAPPMTRIGHRLVIRREAAEAWLKSREAATA
jgi:predicted DNA-binding transcriptional regulator AlpA